MRHIFAIIIIIVFTNHLRAQYLLSFHTEWDDSFKEWLVIVEENDSTIVEGSIDIRWSMDNDFDTYDIRIGENFGELKQVYKNNPTHWQLILNGQMVTITQTWPRDVGAWKMSIGKQTLNMNTRYSQIYDDWTIENHNLGQFNVYTETIGDTRDWIVDDFLNNDIPFVLRLAAAFVPIIVSSPKL